MDLAHRLRLYCLLMLHSSSADLDVHFDFARRSCVSGIKILRVRPRFFRQDGAKNEEEGTIPTS